MKRWMIAVLWGFAGVMLAVVLSFGAFALAGKDIGAPAQALRIGDVKDLAPAPGEAATTPGSHKPHPASHDTTHHRHHHNRPPNGANTHQPPSVPSTSPTANAPHTSSPPPTTPPTHQSSGGNPSTPSSDDGSRDSGSPGGSDSHDDSGGSPSSGDD